MKRFLCVLALGVATIAVATPALADTPGCVSRAEYRQVHRGMTKPHVHRIFDTAGHRDAAHGNIEVRGYRTCPRHSAVSLTYRKRRVSTKVAIWH
jgi:hypothetical protein